MRSAACTHSTLSSAPASSTLRVASRFAASNSTLARSATICCRSATSRSPSSSAATVARKPASFCAHTRWWPSNRSSAKLRLQCTQGKRSMATTSGNDTGWLGAMPCVILVMLCRSSRLAARDLGWDGSASPSPSANGGQREATVGLPPSTMVGRNPSQEGVHIRWCTRSRSGANFRWQCSQAIRLIARKTIVKRANEKHTSSTC